MKTVDKLLDKKVLDNMLRIIQLLSPLLQNEGCIDISGIEEDTNYMANALKVKEGMGDFFLFLTEDDKGKNVTAISICDTGNITDPNENYDSSFVRTKNGKVTSEVDMPGVAAMVATFEEAEKGISYMEILAQVQNDENKDKVHNYHIQIGKPPKFLDVPDTVKLKIVGKPTTVGKNLS